MLPRDAKKAIELIEADPARHWRIDELAAQCGVARRTLEKHFRRFVGCGPFGFLRAARLAEARRRLLDARPGATVASVAIGTGFSHLGRFALAYRRRYGEAPVATLGRMRRAFPPRRSSPWRMPTALDRPSLAVLPFGLAGPAAAAAAGLDEDVAGMLCRLGWIALCPPPQARYHLRGSLRDDGASRLRVQLLLRDRQADRFVWADTWECDADDRDGLWDRVSRRAAHAAGAGLKGAEMGRAAGGDGEPTAWSLSMRALPLVLSADPSTSGTAVALLAEARRRAAHDPIPLSLSAWCHGLRAGHHFSHEPEREHEAALRLAAEAAALPAIDPLSDTMLAAAYMLVHDLAASEMHARSALAGDGGSAWAWGRLAWVHAYRGEAGDAIEGFRIARMLSPNDPQRFVWSIGIAAANFELGNYGEAVRWYRHALAEQPAAAWIHRFLAPACIHLGRRDEAESSFTALSRSFPELTIATVRRGLPHTATLLDRVAEGLERVGMPLA